MGLFSSKSKVIDEKRKKENLKLLKSSDRLQEAIAYTYLMYAELIEKEYKKPRRVYETIREYSITLVNQLGQKPNLIYPFVKMVEDIIYGGKQPTEQQFNDAINAFSQLYNEVTGDTFSLS